MKNIIEEIDIEDIKKMSDDEFYSMIEENRRVDSLTKEITNILKCKPEEIAEKTQKLIDDVEEKKKSVQDLKDQLEKQKERIKKEKLKIKKKKKRRKKAKQKKRN